MVLWAVYAAHTQISKFYCYWLPSTLISCLPCACLPFWTAPAPCSVAVLHQVWEQQQQQTEQAWKALRVRLDTIITATAEQQQQQSAADSPALGVRGLAASRAQARQVRGVCHERWCCVPRGGGGAGTGGHIAVV